MPYYPAPLAVTVGPLSGLEIGLAAVASLLAFVIWLLTRHQECRYSGEPPGEIDGMLGVLAGLTHGSVTEGNSVELIREPAFFDHLCEDIAAATHSIHIETFMWQDGKVNERLSSALCDASERGVNVRVITDARGSTEMRKKSRKRLEDAGCELHWFHRWKLMNLGRFNIRDHRKIAVFDGSVAYVGGHCISDHWLEDQDNLPTYSDISAKLRGPVVGHIQSVFSENWTESGCGLFVNTGCFPDGRPEGSSLAHVAYVRPDGCPPSVQILHYMAIAMAKKTIRIQSPYFLPDMDGVKALAKAARRGVDVRIMTPAVEATDSFFVTYAGHCLFDDLLGAGVRIFEYQPTLLHQKIITVDGKWCGIGSSNFDDRSFKINDEITVGLCDERVVAELDGIFAEDENECVEIDPEKWGERSILAKIRERLFYLFKEQL